MSFTLAEQLSMLKEAKRVMVRVVFIPVRWSLSESEVWAPGYYQITKKEARELVYECARLRVLEGREFLAWKLSEAGTLYLN